MTRGFNPKGKKGGRGGRLACIAALLFLPLFMGMLHSSSCLAASETGAATRVVIDRAGRKVRIPAVPQRIACIFGPSYEKLFALGGADRVSVVHNLLVPWNYELNPGLKQIPVVEDFTAPDVEQLLQLRTDLVIYHPFAKQIAHLSAAGLPVVVPYDGRKRQETLEDFIQDCYGQIRFYGEVLGGKARDIAEEYCAYVDERIRKVIAATAKIPTARRPRVFFVCGQVQGPSDTQTRYSTAYWLVEAAGGTMLTHDESSYFVSVTTEQMLLWDPDIILVSTLPSVDAFAGDPRWRGLKAVRENKVFMVPEGQFYWSHFSTESFLCILYLAKIFHPDLFPHLDIRQELKDYYARFYHRDLTEDEAQRILDHLPPLRESSTAASGR
jgi:iron complex transport system substrate-binding protein